MERRETQPSAPVCPVCGGPVAAVQCKLFCTRCRALVSNCNGD